MLTLPLTLLPNILSKYFISLFDFQNQKIATLRCDKQQKLLFFTSTFWVKRVGKFPNHNQHSKSLAHFFQGWIWKRTHEVYSSSIENFSTSFRKKNFIGQEYLKLLPKHMLLVHKNAYQFVSVIFLCAMHLLFRV